MRAPTYGKLGFVSGCIVCRCGSTAYQSTFLQSGSNRFLFKAGPKRANHEGSSMVMYFDDVSRYTTNWQPDHTGGAFPWLSGSSVETEMEQRAAKDKMECLRRLNGHDAESAASLNDEEIELEMREWADRSGLVGMELGDEIYETLKGIRVSNATTIPGVMSDFWTFVVATIQEGTRDFTGDWIGSAADDAESKGSALSMIVFPKCNDLFDYKTMSTVHAAIDFCSDICLHFGKDFSLTHFHPKYKNAPKMVYPTRHSPFPCLGLHFAGGFDHYVTHLSHKFGTDRAKEAIASAAPPATREWAKERAATFEVLLNKAAASSTQDDLGRPTSLRNISQRFPKKEVIETAEKWVADNRFKQAKTSGANTRTNSKREPNKALEFGNTVGEWNVVYEKTPEEVYAKMWGVISQLGSSGAALDGAIEEVNGASFETQKRYSQLAWMSLLPLPFKNKADGDAGNSMRVISSMFVTTKFRAYNSEGFKRFAITVNAALKRLTEGKIFLEVFHPEYVGRKGYDSKLRRSPFPMIQICYDVGKPSSKRKDEKTEGCA